MDLSGKAVIVTGASSGIGEAVALALAERGARVTLTARRVDRLEALAKRIADSGGQALAAPADLRDEAAIVAVFDASQSKWGRLDVLVNNAGLGRPGALHEGVTDHWRLMLEVNVLALAICTREALARFGEAGGHVVNVSSMAAHRVPPGGGFYAATKHAVRALTEQLRQECRRRKSPTRVSAVSPGFVATEFFDDYYGDPQKVKEALSRYRVLDPSDVAAAVLHALTAPDHVSIHDVLMRPTEQET